MDLLSPELAPTIIQWDIYFLNFKINISIKWPTMEWKS